LPGEFCGSLSLPVVGVTDSRSLRCDDYVRMQHVVRRSTFIPFRRFLWGVRREFMQGLFAALHGTLGSHLRDASHEATAGAVACLNVPRAKGCGGFSSFSLAKEESLVASTPICYSTNCMFIFHSSPW
jgi:hypothetical protein